LATNAAVLAFLDLLNGCANQLMDQLKTAHRQFGGCACASQAEAAGNDKPRAYDKECEGIRAEPRRILPILMPSSISGRPRSMFARSPQICRPLKRGPLQPHA
jgi:hypothetical protein